MFVLIITFFSFSLLNYLYIFYLIKGGGDSGSSCGTKEPAGRVLLSDPLTVNSLKFWPP